MTGRRRNGTMACVGAGFVALDVVRPEWRDGTELRFAGGSCGNVLTILSFFGWKSSVVARIGQDLAGQELAGDLERWSVDTHMLIREESGRTPIVFQRLFDDREGHRQHSFSRYCSVCGEWAVRYRPVRLREADAASAGLPTAQVFYFDRVAPGNLELARRAHAAGALVVFEPPSVNDTRLFSECLRLTHIFKYSHARFDSHAELISDALVPIVIQTRGEEGLRVTVRQKRGVVLSEHMPAFLTPQLTDAAGSGDWCTAGLIHRLVSERIGANDISNAVETITRALRFAQALSAMNCAFEGARGVMYRMSREKLLRDAAALAEGRRPRLLNRADDETIAGPLEGTACAVCDRSL